MKNNNIHVPNSNIYREVRNQEVVLKKKNNIENGTNYAFTFNIKDANKIYIVCNSYQEGLLHWTYCKYGCLMSANLVYRQVFNALEVASGKLDGVLV